MINQSNIPGDSIYDKKDWIGRQQARVDLAVNRAYGFTESFDINRSNIIETYLILDSITRDVRLSNFSVDTYNKIDQFIELLSSINTSPKCSFKIEDWKSVYKIYKSRFAKMNIILPSIEDTDECTVFKGICVNNITNALNAHYEVNYENTIHKELILET